MIAVALRRTTDLLLDALLPPLCLGCQEVVEKQGTLCAQCWQELKFLSPPWCACCGVPFELDLDLGGITLCAACLAEPPAYDTARAVLAYDDASRPLILSFKHGDRTEAALAYGRWLARIGADVLQNADFIVPVPLHRWRLFRRRYNQAALLAKAVSRPSQFCPDLLIRTRATPSQGTQTRRGRFRNVKGAFAVKASHRNNLAGKRTVLIDDVLTTGATLTECARILKAAGAVSVSVLTLARVVRA